VTRRRSLITRVAVVAAAIAAASVGSRLPGFTATVLGAQLGQPAPAASISPVAAAQIDALLLEKASRTEAQLKLDSRLIFELKMSRGQPVAAGVDRLANNLPSVADHRLRLDVQADVSDSLLDELRGLGAEILSSDASNHEIHVLADLDRVELLASLPAVTFIQPQKEFVTSGFDGRPTSPPPLKKKWNRDALVAALRRAVLAQSATSGTGQGSVTSQGDATHSAAAARSIYGVDGTGVKIGVLSDGVSHLSSSQALGDLGTVTVLPGQTGSGDEGTAMLEIIHDLAPGAQLYFATASSGITNFANNIRALRAAGCDIIVDDVFYFVETPFQDGQAPSVISTTNGGVVIQAVKDVTAGGALYFSAAGNSGNLDAGTSGTWEGDFVDGGSSALESCPSGCRIHSFGAQTYDVITSNSGNPISLYWSDPLGQSANDYDLFVLDSTGTTVLAASTNVQTGTQDPFEIVAGQAAGSRIVIVKHAGSPRFLHLSTNRSHLSIATSGETHGHAATSAAASFDVAATPAGTTPFGGHNGPYPNPFNATDTVETFSSDGPRRIFFAGDGTALTPGNLSSTGGQVLIKPDITAADGVSVTGVGGFPTPFFGTSAAAPHAAAIAALVKSRNLSLTPAQIRAALTTTAIDIQAIGTDRDSGAGIVMADAAVAAVSTGPSLAVSATTVAPGAPVTVTLTNGLGGVNDFLALAATGAPDATYLQSISVAGVTTTMWTVSMPGTEGQYEFRLFQNGGATRLATSAPVTVLNAGWVSGTVTNVATGGALSNISAQLYNASGNLVTTAVSVSGNYITSPVPPGTYFARTTNSVGFIDQLYNNISCVGCVVTTGTPISVVAGATTSNINFPLSAGGGLISGSATNTGTGAAIANLVVQVYSSTGAFVTTTSTNTSGNYTVGGVTTGNYFAKTGNATTIGFADQLYNHLPCIGCDPTTGTPIAVTNGTTTGSINFALSVIVNQAQGPNLGTYSIGAIQIPLSATGGNGAYSWSVIAGALPPGISLRTDSPPSFPVSASAGLVGVGTTPGLYTFTLRVSSGGATADQVCTINVTRLTIKDGNHFNYLPDGFVGTPYSYQMTALNAAGAVTWSATSLPAGMNLSPSGILSGTPSAASLTGFQVTVTDGVDTVSRILSLSVNAINITTPGVLPNATLGFAYSQTLTATGGTAPYTFTGCCLGNGLTLSPSGTISGTVPSTGFLGPMALLVTATDSTKTSVVKYISIDVVGAPALPAISLSRYGNFDDCSLGVVCSRGINVQSGGTAPFTWMATGLPPGMSIRSGDGGSHSFVSAGVGWGYFLAAGDAELWGVPTAAGTFNASVTVTDSTGAASTSTFPITVGQITQPNSVASATMNVAYSQKIREIGGTPPYTGAKISGTLPAGLTFDPSTLVVSGTPIENGFFGTFFTFTDSGGQSLRVTENVSVAGPSTLSIASGGNLGSIAIGSAYSTQLLASGAASYVWSIVGGAAPPGFLLSANGLLNGTPLATGTYTFLVRAADASNPASYAQRQFTIHVVASGTVLSIATGSLPFGNVGSAYFQALAAVGGVGPLTWSLAPANLLPPGLSLSPAGVIIGTPATPGQFVFTVSVTDGLQIASRSFSLSIYPAGAQPPLFLNIGPSFTTIVGRFTAQLAATGGVAPYHYSLTPGATEIPGMRVQDGAPLPLSFASNVTAGYIGVLTAAGTFNTSIRVTDNTGATFDRPITLVVVPFTIISTQSPPRATVNTAYSFTVAAFPAAGNYSWSATGLPLGLSINSSTGVISGTPTAVGVVVANVTLTDLGTSKAVSQSFLMSVDPFGITTGAVLPPGVVGAAYNTALAAPSCGFGCAWSTASLPSGLVLSSNGMISGTPTSLFNGSVLVIASGSNGVSQKRFGIVIANSVASAPQITSAPTQVSTVGNAVAIPLIAFGGTLPYGTWSVQSGSLPDGVTLQGPGEALSTNLTPGTSYLAGRPTVVGSYNFTIAVTDAANVTTSTAFTWNVSALSNEYVVLPLTGTLNYNTPYSQPLLALGGTFPYTWTATGAPPPGLTLSNSGLLSGTPTAPGIFATLIQITDTGAANSLASTELITIGGATITGKVTTNLGQSLANVVVQLYDSTGAFVTSASTNTSGNYASPPLKTGRYFARTSNAAGLMDLLYNGIVCSGCDPTTGTPIDVTSPNTASNVNFALPPGGGRVSGRVTDAASGSALAGVTVQIYNSSGGFATSAVTSASGTYTSNAALASGNYVARTFNSIGYLNRLFNNFLCVVFCDVTTGTPIPVVGPSTTTGVNFALSTPTVPAITSISPSTVLPGGAAFTLTVNGTGFAETSRVMLNGVDRTLAILSSTQATARIQSGDIASAGLLTITVVTPAPGGGTSNGATLTVAGPTLTVSGTTVPVAGPLQVMFSTGPGTVGEWVGLYPATAPGPGGYVDWQWITGGRSVAGSAVSGTLTFPSPGVTLAPGDYVIRWETLTNTVLATSPTLSFQVINPTPTVTTISPASLTATSPAFAMTVTGTGFVTGAVVQVDGSARPTTFLSATQVQAAIPASDVATAGSHTITVVNPTTCVNSVCTSNGVTLTVTPAPGVPTVTGITPSTVTPGGPAFGLAVTGTNFAANSVLQVNGTPRATTVTSATALTGTILASDIASGGLLTITVVTPAPGGGTSNGATLTVAGPTLTVSGTTVPVAGPLQVTFGTGPGTVGEWVGLYPATAPGPGGYVDWQWITGGRSAAGSAVSGTLTFPSPGVTLAPGDYVIRWETLTNTVLATSPTVSFQVVNPTPTVTTISPASLAATSPAFAMTVTGTGFVTGAVVQVDGSARPTMFLSATQVQAAIPASDVATAGSHTITVVNPTACMNSVCTSNGVTLTVTGPTLTVSGTTVPVAGPLQVTFNTGPGTIGEWVAVYPATTPGPGGYVDWQWITGGRSVAGSAVSGTLTFPSPGVTLAPGDYVIRWETLTNTMLATSPTVTFQVINAMPTVAASPTGSAESERTAP
jgi:hypothetical protein